jgi:hypothetical protein
MLTISLLWPSLCAANRVPLQQLEARYALRAARPDGEAVEDEVQYALAAEAAQLAAVSAQLSQRVDAADTQIARLDELSAALLQNIADKEAAMTLEEKVALLDGRALPAVPPTPSVLSVSGYLVLQACRVRGDRLCDQVLALWCILDARVLPAVPPTPSVLSVSGYLVLQACRVRRDRLCIKCLALWCMLDGRVLPAVPPTPSMLSVSGGREVLLVLCILCVLRGRLGSHLFGHVILCMHGLMYVLDALCMGQCATEILGLKVLLGCSMNNGASAGAHVACCCESQILAVHSVESFPALALLLLLPTGVQQRCIWLQRPWGVSIAGVLAGWHCSRPAARRQQGRRCRWQLRRCISGVYHEQCNCTHCSIRAGAGGS